MDEDAADVAATATVQSSWDSADQDANPVWSATEALSEAQGTPLSAPKDPLEAYHAIAFDNEIAVCDKPGIGVMPSHEHVDLIPGTNVPAYLGGWAPPNGAPPPRVLPRQPPSFSPLLPTHHRHRHHVLLLLLLP